MMRATLRGTVAVAFSLLLISTAGAQPGKGNFYN